MADEAFESFEKFNYVLRPCKQVERRLLIEALLKLAEAGYSIGKYRYLGFGSPYYADFVLFHKYLYIDDMWCVERSDIPKRMRFNRPYKFIKLKMKEYSEVIPEIVRDKHHVIWLDYDRVFDPEMLSDIDSTMQVIPAGSVFIVTIDARAKLPKDQDDDGLSPEDQNRRLVQLWMDWFDNFYGEDIGLTLLARNEVPKFFYQVALERIRESLSIRDGLQFLPLFNFQYADGALMLTLGGLIDVPKEVENVARSGILDMPFVNQNVEPIEISVPALTIREKLWLDAALNDGLSVEDLEFELREELLENYRKYYRDYPTYTEALM